MTHDLERGWPGGSAARATLGALGVGGGSHAVGGEASLGDAAAQASAISFGTCEGIRADGRAYVLLDGASATLALHVAAELPAELLVGRRVVVLGDDPTTWLVIGVFGATLLNVAYGLVQLDASSNIDDDLLSANVALLDAVQTFIAQQTISSSTAPVLVVERLSTSTTARLTTHQLIASTSNNMADGFGTALLFSIKDNAAGPNDIALVAGIRDGADDSGALVFLTYLAGVVAERMRINSAGQVMVGATTAVARFAVVHAVTGGYTAHRALQFSADAADNSGVANTSEISGVYGISRITATNTSDNTNANGLSGLVGDVRTVANAAGTISNVHSFLAPAIQNAGNTVLSNAYGFRMNAATNAGGGSITRLIGVAVNQQTVGTNNTLLLLGTLTAPTGNYAVYSSSAYQSYIAGNVGIGATVPHSKLQVAGPIATAFSAKTTTYVLTATDSVVSADATGGAFTVTLPTAVGIAGRQYTVKRINSGANNVTVACNGLQTIDGAATSVLTAQWQVLRVVSDGANWLVV